MVPAMPRGWFKAIVVFFLACNRVVDGKYTGAEIRSKQEYSTAEGRCTKVEWRARPAVGNCVITLFSLFNGDLVFDSEAQHNRPAWSEIGIETFGGSANHSTNTSQFQTQLISEASPEVGKKQHIMEHMIDENANITNIFDHGFHTFGIEFCPSANQTATNCTTLVTYLLDRKVIRREAGGDLCHLVPPFDIYAANWVGLPQSTWACSSDEARPFLAEAVVEYIQVYDNDAVVQKYVFDNENDVITHWDRSDWGFGVFDGVYDPKNIDVVRGKAVLKLIKDTKVTN